MIRTQLTFPVSNYAFLRKALYWANSKNNFSYFSGNNTPYPYDSFPSLLAVGSTDVLNLDSRDPFTSLSSFHDKHKDWITGFFGYDIKNKIEELHSNNTDHIEFPEGCFFVPESLIFIKDNNVIIRSCLSPEIIYNEIDSFHVPTGGINKIPEIKCDTKKQEYLDIVQKIKKDIEEGDYCELNFCIEFYSRNIIIDPVSIFQNLSSHSKAPFSTLQKFNNHYIISASPERFLKKTDDEIISQPMKGTRSRSKTPQEDQELKEELRNNEKEIAENMMIVDLVRNDLAKSCLPGTVVPEEMFGVYSFPQVHQMISTIKGRLDPDLSLMDPVRNAFPMGSMTGAPKIMVMNRIDQYEKSKRGPFSGASGYITPSGNYDFNVLIRSIFYNRQKQKLKLNAGSAITYDSDPQKEYEECMLKAEGLLDTLSFKTKQTEATS